jgi:acetyl-CoA carboxylase biotin carboxyl carrier protein
MDLDQLKQILDLVRQHELSEFELEHEGLRLKVRMHAGAAPAAVQTAAAAPQPVAPLAPPPVAAPVAVGAPGPRAESPDMDLAVVKSPIVGTFYRSPEPGAPPFVEIGSNVKRGQVLCIVEAMKLMNEIDSDYDGEIANVYVENGQPVQFGERLFAIRTR